MVEADVVFKQRIENAIQRGEAAFWAEIAKEFPDIETGDFPPDADFAFKQAMERAVDIWFDCNAAKRDKKMQVFEINSTNGMSAAELLGRLEDTDSEQEYSVKEVKK